MVGGREELPVIACHRTMWVAGSSPLMPRPCLTWWGRDQTQHKRESGPECLHPLRSEVVTDTVLLVYLVSVHWEHSRAFHRGLLRPEGEGRTGPWRLRFISLERDQAQKDGARSRQEGCKSNRL